jgi:hypothetical protein
MDGEATRPSIAEPDLLLGETALLGSQARAFKVHGDRMKITLCHSGKVI